MRGLAGSRPPVLPAALAALALSLAPACATAPRSQPDLAAEATPPLQLEANQIVVALELVTPALRQELARRLARNYDLEIVGAFPLRSIEVFCIVYEIDPARDVDATVEAVSRHPGVRLAQRNQHFNGLGVPGYSDPYARFQYGAERLRAAQVHVWTTGRGVRIAVIDTGADTGHPDLAGRIGATENFVEDGESSFDRDDHGTSVAGLIVGRPDNDEGIYGVAPDAEVLVSKACWHPAGRHDEARCSSWTLARAIDHAIGQEVRVINLSLGGPADPLLSDLLATAEEAGIVVVAAAGHDGGELRFPASLDSVIAVVATDVDGVVVAPPRGESARLVAAPGLEILTPAPGGGYRFASGSSLSTAYVSGVAALLLAVEPGLAPAELASLLEAEDVDACRALHRLSRGTLCP